MNYNIIAYSIYLPIIVFIMVKIGWLLYVNGEIFLKSIFNYNLSLVVSTNKLLLTAYYLTNIGYAIYSISNWETLNSNLDIINSVSASLGGIILLLAIMHYNNIFWLKFINNINIQNK